MPHDIINSVLRYGGVEIPFLRIEEFKQEPVWSADGTDLLYTHITVAVSGVINACFLHGNMDPACWVEASRPILLQRGHQLDLFIGGVQIIPPAGPTNPNYEAPTTGMELLASPSYTNATGCISPGQGTQVNVNGYPPPLDAKLGPKPITLDIRAIRGGTYAIFYRIETWVPYCANNGNPGAQSILSNRWESVLDIDQDYFYTRTTNGTLVMNGQVLEAYPAPTILNNNALLILPPLFKNWRRQTLRFSLSSDQLTLTYSIVDRQQYTTIPRPCVHIEATYAEIAPAPQVQQGYALLNVEQQNCDVTVHGDPSTFVANSYPTGNPVNPDQLKYILMQIMFQIVFSRIKHPFTTAGSDGKLPMSGSAQYITHFELREDMFQPIVGCRVVAFVSRDLTGNPLNSSATWQSNIFNQTDVASPILIDDMLQQLPTQPISVGNWATYLLLCSVAPQDPCAGGHIPAVYGQYTPYGTEVYSSQTQSGQTTTGTGYQQIVNRSYSCANYAFPFTEYTATVDYPTDFHTLQLPIMYDVEQGTTSGTTRASAVFCQTASPTTKKVVHWKASRIGAWPKAPSPTQVDYYGDSTPADRVLRSVPLSVGEVELGHDGLTRHYQISGMMEIGMARRLQWDRANTIISTITNPVIGSSVYGDQDAGFPTTTLSGSGGFVSGILGSGQSPGNC